MTTFSDIFKSSFLEKVSTFSITDVFLALLASFAIGLFIFFIYKKTFQGVMYSASFGISLLVMSLVTTLIILAISSNVILSLGMVGALSIVRFRSAVKEPMDIAYLFWAISAGIVVGAGLIPLAVVGSLVIGLILYVFANRKSAAGTPYMVIVNCEHDAGEQEAFSLIELESKRCLLKSKSISPQGVELTVEVRVKDASARLINQLMEIDGVTNAVLVSYNGEYMA